MATELSAPMGIWRKARLWAEFLALYLGAPVAVAYGYAMVGPINALIGLTVLGLILLTFTPSFRWRSFVSGWRGSVVWPTMIFILASAAIIYALTVWLRPGYLFGFPTHRTELWLKVVMLYPLVSVIPQEILYRSLFFERYGVLLPNATMAVAVNAAAFGLGHLFYWNWVAVLLTTLGGAAYAWIYLRSGRGLGMVWIWHSLSGLMVFTFGLGGFFYRGLLPV